MNRDDASAVASWIAGLMRENYEALGFLPEHSAVRDQYVVNDRFVLQHDEAGRRVGYLLHGAPAYGRTLHVAQHCIQTERRQHGYGESALRSLIERAESAGCAGILARCATTLPSLEFWLAEGFQLIEIVPGGLKRGRSIARLYLPLALPLLDGATETARTNRTATASRHEEARRG